MTKGPSYLMFWRHNKTAKSAGVRPRPAWLRALGRDDPPATVEIDGRRYERVEIFKHDSWAATALYCAGDVRVICKFNRRQSIFGLPMGRLGRLLARREAGFLRRLGDLAGIPAVLGVVNVAGQPCEQAIARHFVPGHTLQSHERTADDFFPRLERLLAAIHARGMAYVDLHKRENVLVGDDGCPYLFDFQVSFGPRARWWSWFWPRRTFLSALQRMDNYHLLKLHKKCRPDQCALSADELAEQRPRLVRWHRRIAAPLRNLRRRLLARLGVRTAKGRVESEHFTEASLRS